MPASTAGWSARSKHAISCGAHEAGHEVIEYNLIGEQIGGCIGCGMAGSCVQKDEYEGELEGLIREADTLAFAFPVYYYNWPSQLKAVVDCFYSFTYKLMRPLCNPYVDCKSSHFGR